MVINIIPGGGTPPATAGEEEEVEGTWNAFVWKLVSFIESGPIDGGLRPSEQ